MSEVRSKEQREKLVTQLAAQLRNFRDRKELPVPEKQILSGARAAMVEYLHEQVGESMSKDEPPEDIIQNIQEILEIEFEAERLAGLVEPGTGTEVPN